MNNYKELKGIYKPVFLHYIIKRSRDTARTLGLEYEDLTQEGLMKLVEMTSNTNNQDPTIMKALVNLYNDILDKYENKVEFLSFDTDIWNKLLKEEEIEE